MTRSKRKRGEKLGLEVGHKASDVSSTPSTKRILVKDWDDGFGGTSSSARHGLHLRSPPTIPLSTPSTRMAEDKENLLPIQEPQEEQGGLQSRGLSHSAPSIKIKGAPSIKDAKFLSGRPRGVLQSLTPNSYAHLGQKGSLRIPLQRHPNSAHHNVPMETEDASKVNIGHSLVYHWTHPPSYCS